MIKHDEARKNIISLMSNCEANSKEHYLKIVKMKNENIEYITQQEQLTKAVKEYFRLENGVIGREMALRLIALEKTIKEMVGE